MLEYQDDISLDMIRIEKYYRVSKSSLPQLLVRLKMVNIDNPKNSYEFMFNKLYRQRVQIVINEYNKVLKYRTSVEYYIKVYNLFGRLPKNIIIETFMKGSDKLFQSRVGDLITAIKQRIEFIIDRNVPQVYYLWDYNEELNYVEEFNKMQNELTKFWYTIDKFEKDFKEIIYVSKRAITLVDLI